MRSFDYIASVILAFQMFQVTTASILPSFSAGESLHFDVVLPTKVKYPSIELEVLVGSHRVQLDDESTFLHQGEDKHQFFIRIPQGAVAGVHRVSAKYLNNSILSQDVAVKPSINRVVKNPLLKTFHIDGSGFALEDTQVLIDGSACEISDIDYHHLVCSVHDLEMELSHVEKQHMIPGVKLILGSNDVAYLKASVSWPSKHFHEASNLHNLDADAVNTYFIAPETGEYTFQLHCHDNQELCGTFEWNRDSSLREQQRDTRHLVQGRAYPVNLAFRGQGYYLSVSIVSSNFIRNYERVPASWFYAVETLELDHDVLVQSNGESALQRFHKIDTHDVPRHAVSSLKVSPHALSSNPRLLQDLSGSSKFSEWQAASGCRDCVIPHGTSLSIDQNIDVDSLTVQGSLLWDTASLSDHSQLTTGFLMVENGGKFELNAASTSNRATIFIKNNGKSHSVFGERSVGTSHNISSVLPPPIFKISGRSLRTWSLLTGGTHTKGANTLTLEHDAQEMGWNVGDRIVIANTDIPTIHQTSFLGPQVAEIEQIQGNIVTIRGTTLNQDFFGDKEKQMQAEVINLSRNVEITGDAFENLKGLHVVGGFGGEMQISHTRISKCGRRGELGRYCLHFHMMNDCPTCAFVGNAIEDSHQRGIVVHGTHRSLSTYNVMYMVRGSGIYVEDGNEMHNTIQYNVNLCHSSGSRINACKAPGSPDDQADNIQQSGIWAIAMTNNFIGNRMVNHYNGFFTQVSLFPHGRGHAAGKVCTEHAPLGVFRGNVQHSNMRFGFYLDNNWPRDIQRDENGYVIDMAACATSTPENPCSCDAFKADGSDNGKLGIVEDGLEYGNTFVGQYELGDVQYLRLRSINNLHNMYWKVTKNFADGHSSHIKDSRFEYYPLPGFPGSGVGHILGPGGLGSFIIENTKFIGHMVEGGICANQHCTVAGTGALCTPEYTLVRSDLSGMPANMRQLRFGISDGDPERPIFTSPDGSIPGAVSVASKYMTFLLTMEENGETICRKAADVGLGTQYDDGIVCSKPLRRLQLWTQSSLGTLQLTSDVGSVHNMKFIEPCPGGSSLCIHKQGYGVPVIVGHEYSINLNPSDNLVWEFSDVVFSTRFQLNESIRLRFADHSICNMVNTHSRKGITVKGPVGALPLGACSGPPLDSAPPPALSRATYHDSDLHGTSLSEITLLTSIDQCNQKCFANVACLGFTWTSNNVCSLKSTPLFAIVPLAGSTSVVFEDRSAFDPKLSYMIWSDEFEGSSVNTDIWGYEISPPGTHNNELQSYTSNSANSYVQDGMLHISALQSGSTYTSARMVTKGKKDWMYGRVRVRAKMPIGTGLWPGIWMLNSNSPYVWPTSGEMDIMEHVTCEMNVVHATIHDTFNNFVDHNAITNSTIAQVADFHVYGLDWDEHSVKISLDEHVYFDYRNDFKSDVNTWPFNNKFYMLLDVAVGGIWGGECLGGKLPNVPNDGTNRMSVDYVRVYTIRDPLPIPTFAPTTFNGTCVGPYPEEYINCEPRMDWLLANWNKVAWSQEYIDHGVDGSRCSIQNYLNKYEGPYCPPIPTGVPTPAPTIKPTSAPTKSPPPTPPPTAWPSSWSCEGPYPSSFPDCSSRMQWMLDNWNKVAWSQTYRDHGVDGSRCSIQNYLSKYEGPYCPPVSGPSSSPTQAPTPSPSPTTCLGPYPVTYPECESRMEWMLANWNKVAWSQTYRDHGVDGSRCSIQNYLNQFEGPYCPPVPMGFGLISDVAVPSPTNAPTNANCEGPYPAEYPECEDRMRWMVANWDKVEWSDEYRKRGVDGSRCSIQHFVNVYEGPYCPEVTLEPTTIVPTMQPSSSPTPDPLLCEGPYPKEYPECEGRIRWMVENWDKVEWSEEYRKRGVDGSRCSIQYFVNTYEGQYCPPAAFTPPTATPTSSPTAAPTPDPFSCESPYPAEYPECEDRMRWMVANWDKVEWSNEYRKRGVDGSRCSIQNFVNMYEGPYCPPVPISTSPTGEQPTRIPTMSPTIVPTTRGPTFAPTTFTPTSAPTTPSSTPIPTLAPTSTSSTFQPTITPSTEEECVGPYPPEYPECEDRMRWLVENWDKVSWSDIYRKKGIDGSRCSVQAYLNLYEGPYCPPAPTPIPAPTASPTIPPESHVKMFPDSELHGTELRVISNTESVAQCQDACQQEKDCIGFSMSQLFVCVLKASPLLAAVPARGYTSGVMTDRTDFDSSISFLIWQDEFEGNSIDTDIWGYDIFPPYQYNEELQSYTSDPQNSFVQDGNLHIQVHQQGQEYTSARMITKGKRDWMYGRVRVRAKLPSALGLWPAIWMLNSKSSFVWPKSGEMDIMEMVTCDMDVIHATTHTYNNNFFKHNEHTASTRVSTLDYQVYGLDWDQHSVRVLVNERVYFEYKNDFKNDINTWPFNNKFHILLNIAVGGSWGGYCLWGDRPTIPSDGTNEMLVDYVRVYSIYDPVPIPTPAPTVFDGTCNGPYSQEYIECEDRMQWMLANWDQVSWSQLYRDRGVDGSRCSIQNYLNIYEGGDYCPPVPGFQPSEIPTSAPTLAPSGTPAPTVAPTPWPTNCLGPYSEAYPECEERMKWMLDNWDSVSWTQTYRDRGVDGSRCSIQNYLNIYEGGNYCPPVVRSI